jgi:hypothetical protein
MAKNILVSPVVKWVGGKRQIMSSIVELLPKNISGYHYLEPFIGGGAVLFHLQPARAFINDFNTELTNLYDDWYYKKPVTDLDIVALVDGQFIIGEAKHNSNEFSADSHKSLKSLVDIANLVHPDKLLLSCYVDENNKLDKAKKFLEHHFYRKDYAPDIETSQLHTPDYFNFNSRNYYFYY